MGPKMYAFTLATHAHIKVSTTRGVRASCVSPQCAHPERSGGAVGQNSDVLEPFRVAQVVTSPRLVVPVRLRELGAARRRGGRLWPAGGARGRRVVAGVEPAVDVLVRGRAVETAAEEEDDDGDGELVAGAGHDVDLDAHI